MLIIRFIFIWFLFIPGQSLIAQESAAGDDMRSISRQLQMMRFGMGFGASYNYMPYYGGGMNYFAAPGFSYPLANKVSFHGGIMTGISTASIPLSGEFNGQGVRYGYTSIFGSVSYQVNPNVVFYGTGIKNLANYGPPSPFSHNSFDEISFGSSIRLGNNITIGGSIHFRENNFFRHGNYAPFWGY